MSILVLALLTAAPYVLAFEPFSLPLLGWLAPLPWAMLAALRTSRRRWLASGYGAGVLIFLVGCSWLANTHWTLLLAVALVAAWYFVLMLALLTRIRRLGLPFALTLPSVWVAQEWLRQAFPLRGFPWLLLGYSQHPFLYLVQLSDLTGVLGVSALMASFSGALFDVVLAWRTQAALRRPVIVLAIAVLAIAGSVGYGWQRVRRYQPSGTGPPLLLVQANIPQELKSRGLDAREVLRRHVEITRQALAASQAPAPIVIWSETMFPIRLPVAEPHADPELTDFVKGNFGSRGAWFLCGVETFAGAGPAARLYNSVVLFSPQGERKALYHKAILVPGGEYIPLIDYLPAADRIRAWVRGFAGFLPSLQGGAGPELMQVPFGGAASAFGVVICYENIYGGYYRQFVDRGAQFMVNVSNEAWFKTSAEMDQMMGIAVFRAAETKRSLARATNTGITAGLDPVGRAVVLIAQGRDRAVAGSLSFTPPLCDERTVYVRYGDWLPLVASVATTLLVIMSWFSRQVVTGEMQRDL
ncbi:MAG: apolipoprotein N-acyltransferase [Planctomycetota bacterium]